MTARPKSFRLQSPEYLDFVRSLPCPCGEPPPSMAHHWPIKGRRRDVDDTRTCPVCARCHQRCHGIVVVHRGKRLMPIPADDQTAAVDATFRAFVSDAPEAAVRKVLVALRARTAAA